MTAVFVKCTYPVYPSKSFQCSRKVNANGRANGSRTKNAVGTTARVLYRDCTPVSYQAGLKGETNHSRVSGLNMLRWGDYLLQTCF